MKVTTTAPNHDNSKPSSQVLSLVSSFLADHGFHSTVKAFRKELKRMNHSVEVLTLGDSQDGVNLQDIVENWNKQELESTQSTSDGTTSDESDGTTSESGLGSSSASSGEESDEGTSSEDTSTPESESESGTDEEKVDTKPRSTLKRVKVNRRDASPSASSSASSDSDADDERETGAKAKPKATRKKSPTTSKGVEKTRTLKRKAASSSPESSSSESDSSDGDRPAKRAKIDASDDTDESSSSDMSSSSSAEESDDVKGSSTKEEEEGGHKQSTVVHENQARPAAVAEALSDSSSGTVMGDVVEPGRKSSEPEESPARQPESITNKGYQQSVATKKTHLGARPTRLAQLSAQATADSHISNAYQSYDYADRAYKDLSVTRGKGFTKEKNKKKRGSYRGGAIDISGGKSFKFED